MCEPCKNCSEEEMRKYALKLYDRYGMVGLCFRARCERLREVMKFLRKEIGGGRDMEKQSEMQQFGFQGMNTRMLIENGELYFVAKDVADALGYSQFHPNMVKHVPDEWKGSKRITTLGGIQDMTCLSEQGLYFFLARSDKPKALPYQKFVAGEIMPSIRKYGVYMTPTKLEEILADPDTIINLATALKEERTKAKALSATIEANQMKVDFFDTVAESRSALNMQVVAKVLNFEGIGRNNLFEFLRSVGVLMENNLPYQKYVDRGDFRVIESHYMRDGEPIVYSKTLVYQKGMNFIRRKLLEAGYQPRKEKAA